MSSYKSGSMDFLSADLYPNVIVGGVFETDTSTSANPEKDDQQVLGESEEAAEKTSSEPAASKIFLAIIAIIIFAVVFGIGD